MSSKLILLINESDDESVEEVVSVCLNHIAGWNVISIPLMHERFTHLLYKQPDAILFNALLSCLYELSAAQKQIVQRLKYNFLIQTSPILLLIDTANWLTREQLRSLGVSGAIAKPFNPVTLPNQITDILDWKDS